MNLEIQHFMYLELQYTMLLEYIPEVTVKYETTFIAQHVPEIEVEHVNGVTIWLITLHCVS